MDIKELNLNEEQLNAVTKLLQSEGDRVRTEYSGKLKIVNDELLKYKPQEKSESEKALEERLLALEQREKELKVKENKSILQSKFNEKGLPSELANFVNIDGENIDSAIDSISNAINSHYLNSGYKPQAHAKTEVVTKEQYKNMSYMERVALERDNPELVAKFRA